MRSYGRIQQPLLCTLVGAALGCVQERGDPPADIKTGWRKHTGVRFLLPKLQQFGSYWQFHSQEQRIFPSIGVQANGVLVKSAPYQQAALGGGDAKRATFEHHLLFPHSSLLLPCPPLESKGHSRVCGHRNGGLGSRWLLLQDPAREEKPIFRHKENEGTESHWAHVGTGVAFPPRAERHEHPRARRRGGRAAGRGGWRREDQAPQAPGEDEDDAQAGFVAPFFAMG